MSQPDPYGFFAQCSNFTSDNQLMTNTFANIVNTTFTFRCCGFIRGCVDQVGPTFQSCADSSFRSGVMPDLTLCIGGISQPHACAAAGCQQIGRVGGSSPPCSQQLLGFMAIQPAGAQYACCDSTSCALGADYSCSGSRALQLCIGDNVGIECVNPADSTICTGNYTSALAATISSRPGATGSANTNPPGFSMSPFASLPSSHSGLSRSDVPTIAGSIVGGLLLIGLVIILTTCLCKLQKRKRRGAIAVRHTASTRTVLIVAAKRNQEGAA